MKLVSPDGRYVFNIQNDGRIVAYDHDRPVPMRIFDGVLVFGTPEEQPNPVPTGRTRGDFLYPYFGPSYMSWVTLAERVSRFDAQKATGATDILIMAQWIYRDTFTRPGWAGPKGKGFDVLSGPFAMGDFRATLQAIKDRGMRATVVAHDRGRSSDFDEDMLVDLVRRLYDEAGDLIHALLPVFELDEIADETEQVELFARLRQVARGNVTLVAHHSDVQTGQAFWQDMRDAGCGAFFAQYSRTASLYRLAENTKRWIDMLPAEIAFICGEHSAQARYSSHPPAVRDERWTACATVMQALGRPLHSFNSATDVT